jgi:hypothetical protein
MQRAAPGQPFSFDILSAKNRGPPPRSRARPSWAERHHARIGIILTLAGLLAFGAIDFAGIKGGSAMTTGLVAALLLLFGHGFLWNRGAIFPPSEINRRNRWKYLILAAVLWGALFLIWWYRIRPALK